MKIFKIFLKNFIHPILSPPSPQMLYIKYEDFSEDRMEIINYVTLLLLFAKSLQIDKMFNIAL